MNKPGKVSSQVIDAWKAIPPCDSSHNEPYCHGACPYFGECYPEDIIEEEY